MQKELLQQPVLTRRSILKQAATVSALPFFNAAAQSPGGIPNLGETMRVLSDHMAQAAVSALPADVVEHAKQHILDTLAAIVSGGKLEPGKAAYRYLQQHVAAGKCSVIGSKRTAGPIDAALAHGVMAHADETDDSHGRSRSHPGCAIGPAAWACGEYFNASGAQFIRSVVLGYDVGTRVLMAMGGPAFSYSSHKSSHSIAGVFGSAASAVSLAGLNAEQMRWMLDYTAQQSSGIASWGRDVDHIEKAFVFGGMPARSGVTSALLVKTGWNGIQDVFSGADNFFEAYAPNAKTELLIDGLGKRHEVTLTDIKKWTVGSPIQGPLDALELIQAQKAFTVDEVTEVIVRLEPSVAKVVDNRDIPDICLQHMMAVMLMDRTASFKAAHDKDRMREPATLAQRSKVVLVKDDALTALLPVRVAIVEVTLKDGTRLSQKVEAVRGTPRNPMTRQEVIDKAADLMNPVLGKSKTKQLIQTVFALERLPRVQSLRGLLQA